MSYTPHKGRTTKELDYYLSVCRKNGYHCAFPYGWSFANPSAYIYDALKNPVYHGWTLRVFFYAVDKHVGKSQVQVSLDGLLHLSDYIVTEVSQGSIIRTFGKARSKLFSEIFPVPLNQGDHFSIGIQVYTGIPYLRGVFNDGFLTTQRLKDVKDVTRWVYKITADTNIITSIHVYDDLQTNFPYEGLGQEFSLTNVPLPFGSYGIFHTKNTKPSQFLNIILKDKSVDRNIPYYATGIPYDGDFTVYIRNTPTGWLVQPSFREAADLLPHKNIDNVISPIIVDCAIERIYLESSVGS